MLFLPPPRARRGDSVGGPLLLLCPTRELAEAALMAGLSPPSFARTTSSPRRLSGRPPTPPLPHPRARRGGFAGCGPLLCPNHELAAAALMAGLRPPPLLQLPARLRADWCLGTARPEA